MDFHRTWRSLKRGKNVELYLVLVISVVAVVLSIFDVGDPRLVSALTVTAVGLVGLALLEQRFEVQDTLTKIETSFGHARFESERPFDLDQLLRSSSLVMLAGVDLARTFSNYRTQLSNYLERGNELRIMLYDPTSAAVDCAVQRSKRPFSKDRQIQLINDAVSDFKQLELIPQARMQVRLSSLAFPHGIIASNYHSGDGVICLKHYRYRLDNYDLPWMKITSADGIWYEQFATEIDEFWNDARRG